MRVRLLWALGALALAVPAGAAPPEAFRRDRVELPGAVRCERADARELARGLSRPLRELGPGVDEPTVSRLGRPAAAPSGFRPEAVLPETPSVRRTDRR